MKIRNQCGFIGILLPWVTLFSANLAPHPDPRWWWSLSVTYYQTPAFVMGLSALALFLFNYVGYDKLDNIINKLSAIGAIGVAIFPCNAPWLSPDTPVGFFQLPMETSSTFHVISAFIMFFCVDYNFLFLFTKSKPGRTISKKKKLRNRIYRTCGIITIGCFVGSVLTLGPLPGYVNFICETVLVTVFGIGWLVKGEIFPFLYDKDVAPVEKREPVSDNNEA